MQVRQFAAVAVTLSLLTGPSSARAAGLIVRQGQPVTTVSYRAWGGGATLRLERGPQSGGDMSRALTTSLTVPGAGVKLAEERRVSAGFFDMAQRLGERLEQDVNAGDEARRLSGKFFDNAQTTGSVEVLGKESRWSERLQQHATYDRDEHTLVQRRKLERAGVKASRGPVLAGLAGFVSSALAAGLGVWGLLKTAPALAREWLHPAEPAWPFLGRFGKFVASLDAAIIAVPLAVALGLALATFVIRRLRERGAETRTGAPAYERESTRELRAYLKDLVKNWSAKSVLQTLAVVTAASALIGLAITAWPITASAAAIAAAVALLAAGVYGVWGNGGGGD